MRRSPEQSSWPYQNNGSNGNKHPNSLHTTTTTRIGEGSKFRLLLQQLEMEHMSELSSVRSELKPSSVTPTALELRNWLAPSTDHPAKPPQPPVSTSTMTYIEDAFEVQDVSVRDILQSVANCSEPADRVKKNMLERIPNVVNRKIPSVEAVCPTLCIDADDVDEEVVQTSFPALSCQTSGSLRSGSPNSRKHSKGSRHSKGSIYSEGYAISQYGDEVEAKGSGTPSGRFRRQDTLGDSRKITLEFMQAEGAPMHVSARQEIVDGKAFGMFSGSIIAVNTVFLGVQSELLLNFIV
jgi:hypothetical protein